MTGLLVPGYHINKHSISTSRLKQWRPLGKTWTQLIPLITGNFQLDSPQNTFLHVPGYPRHTFIFALPETIDVSRGKTLFFPKMCVCSSSSISRQWRVSRGHSRPIRAPLPCSHLSADRSEEETRIFCTDRKTLIIRSSQHQYFVSKYANCSLTCRAPPQLVWWSDNS